MSEHIERNGRAFTYRDLDREELSEAERQLTAKITLRESRIDVRAKEIVHGRAGFALPKEVNSEKGVTRLEKMVARQALFAIVDADLCDPIMLSRSHRSRMSARISEGYEIPESAFDEDDKPDFSGIPGILVHTFIKGQAGAYLGKEV